MQVTSVMVKRAWPCWADMTNQLGFQPQQNVKTISGRQQFPKVENPLTATASIASMSTERLPNLAKRHKFVTQLPFDVINRQKGTVN